MQQLSYTKPDLTQIESQLFRDFGVSVFMLREDQNHPEVSGNKWWKLKYNLAAAKENGFHQLLTFGGAYSNHIYATAAAAAGIGISSIGIIRGEETLPLNSVLSFALEKGMQLKFVSREMYSRKTDPQFLDSLKGEFGESYMIPEGGTNELALKGCEEFGSFLSNYRFDHLCLSIGTGGTMAGIIKGLNGRRNVIGFSALKGGDFLTETVSDLIQSSLLTNWEIQTDYHFGGYAKSNNELDLFIDSFIRENGIQLEHVYTGKLVYGVYDLIQKNKFEKGSEILILHSGGVHNRKE